MSRVLDKLGIVIPTYNYGQYLESAIISALAAVEWCGGVVVVVDDGSTDNTQEIIKKYPLVKNLKLSRRSGAANARNEGARLYQTEYLLFLDSDDVLIPESIKYMVDTMDANPGENLGYADFQVCDEELYPLYLWSENRDTGPGNQQNKLCWDSIIGMPAMVMRRDAFFNIGMFFPLPRAQDWDLAVRFMALNPLLHINCVAHLRRSFNKNTWEKTPTDRLNNFLQVLGKLVEDNAFAEAFPQLHYKRFACIYRFIGETLIILERYDEARLYLDKAENAVGCFADISLLRADLLIKQGKYETVIRLLNSEHRPYFLKQGPVARLQLLSTAYEKMGKPEIAVELLQQAVVVAPGRFDVYYRLAKLHAANGNHSEAIRWFRRLSLPYEKRYHQYHVSAFYNMADIYRRMNMGKNARYALEGCLRLEPGHEAAKKMLIEVKP